MTQPVRILYVDDYPLDRELVRDALEIEHGGFDVVEAGSRADFETLLAQGGFDLVLSDFNILGFEGLQVLEAVRAKDPNLPVIVVTGTGSEEVAAEAMKLGAADYVLKSPKHILRLPHTIHAALDKQRLEHERQQAEEQLAASEAQLRALFAAMTDAVIVYDREGRYVRIAPTNPINLYGRRENMLGKRVHEIFPKALADFFVTQIAQTLETGEAQQCEYGLQIEGKEVWFSASAAPLSENTVIWVAHDITNRRHAEQALKQQVQRLGTLHNIDQAIAGSTNLTLVLQVILEQTAARLDVDAVSILVLNPHTQLLEYAGARGFRTSAIQEAKVRLGQAHAGRVALERKLIQIPDMSADPQDVLLATRLAGEGFVCYCGAPLIAKGQVKGVLEVFHRSVLVTNAEWIDFLIALAGQAAIAIDSATLFDDLQRSNMELNLASDATIDGWSQALDLRDKETQGHTRRVVEGAVKLGRALGLTEEELVHVRRGAMLHDIGKMGVPDAVLLKPGPLTDEEWVVMKQHPTFAYEVLAPIRYLRAALDIPYCHHEKWDGTGYPRGLKGEQIPLVARMFAAVDVYDALTSDRPYRPAWSAEKARQHILSESGRHFDPRVVETFSSLLAAEEP